MRRTQPSTVGTRECECDISKLECSCIKKESCFVCLMSKGTEKYRPKWTLLGIMIWTCKILYRFLILNSWYSGRGAILESCIHLGGGTAMKELSHWIWVFSTVLSQATSCPVLCLLVGYEVSHSPKPHKVLPKSTRPRDHELNPVKLKPK